MSAKNNSINLNEEDEKINQLLESYRHDLEKYSNNNQKEGILNQIFYIQIFIKKNYFKKFQFITNKK